MRLLTMVIVVVHLLISMEKLIGINSVKLVESSVEGMGFAIPIEVAMSQIDKLESGEPIERPVIGVTLYDLDTLPLLGYSDLRIDDSIKSGVVVDSVGKWFGC